MRRRRRRQKTNPLDYIRLPSFNLDPDIKRGIFVVFILAVGAIGLLSLFGLAGSLGIYMNKFMLLAFGWGRYFFPIILLVFGFMLYNQDKYWIRGANYLGLFLYAISLPALLHLFIPEADWQTTIADGAGGGYLGYAVIAMFNKVMGFWASLIVLLALLLVSLMLMFNATLARVIGRESWFARILYPINFVFDKIFRRNKYAAGQEAEEEEEFIEEPDEEEAMADEKEAELSIAADGDWHSHKIKTEAEAEISAKDAKAAKEKLDSGWQPINLKIDLPLELLNNRVGKPTSGDIKNNQLVIQKTLENFGIPVEMGEVNVGPTVTQFTLKPSEGIKLSRITTLNNDLALALAAHPIRIEAPIPGRSLVGVEVPNQVKAVVGLREVLSDDSFKQRKSSLIMGLGKDVSGRVWFDDLGKMPHLLVAGATNSGKSVCLNSIIVGLLYQNSPDDLRFIMVDPKRVELPIYNGIPHLITPVITDVGKTINALKWCLNEMDRRFETLAKVGKRDIDSFNQANRSRMPYIIFIIDELADLMVAAPRDIEASVIRLAQMARAVGIHLILATQRPSVDIITGLIKANMPARIAFSVASGVDSRTILDSLGAEKLLGRGDMLFTNANLSKPKRLQGAFVSDNEIKRIVSFIKERADGDYYLAEVVEKQKVKGISGFGMEMAGADDDELLEQAKDIIINSGKASASYLQRRLSIGYARAARLLDMLEEAGVIGPGDGAKPREVLITSEQYDNMQETSGVPLHDKAVSQAPDEFLEVEEEAEEDEGDEAGEENETEEVEEEETEAEIKDDKTATKPSDSIDDKTNDDEDEGKYFSR